MNRTPYMGPERKNNFGLIFKFAMFAFIIVVAIIIFYACQVKNQPKLDYDNVELIQYELPDDNTPVVVFETTLGTFKAVLFPEQTPDYYEYFTGLVNDGYYDDTYVFAVQDGVYFMGGSKTDDGVTDSNTDESNFNQELSTNLWPFKGSLIAYGNKSQRFFSDRISSGSRILFVDTVEFTDEFVKELESVDGNKDVVEAFKEKGGVPNFSQQYTIFGQVYDGFDAYDKICTYDVKDEENLNPIDDIKFEKVYMSTYGEHKNDQAFSVKTADSSQTEDSSQSE